ncbi:MAG: DUF2061 domain-containing protein [Pseudomonadota bacterium]
MDSRLRTFVKAALWTLIGLLVMTGVGFAVTGSLTVSGGMAATNSLLGLLIYVAYERIWARIPWGRT